MDDSSKHTNIDEENLAQLRDIILGKDCSVTTNRVKEQSREIVRDVIAEAINDRQKQSADLDNILHPIIESAVESSFSSRSDKLISSLYPLVGRLVRTSVKAFLNEFIEKTNQLLESGLTLRSIKCRIKARQAGISFAQYMTTQTFIYRVDHVLLIHRKTGVLLNSVTNNQLSDANVDLISSMLTAINDFVADSLIANEGYEEHLQTIRTDNFSLLLKPGPEVIVVVAVTGNPPHRLLEKMQLTLENIHRFYDEELHRFDGNTTLFNGTTVLLNNCLLSEEKDINKNVYRKPWLAYLLLAICVFMIGYFTVNSWQRNQLTEQISTLNEQPGYVIQTIDIAFDKTVHISMMRDPETLTIQEWLDAEGIHVNKLYVKEQLFHSVEPMLTEKKLTNILSQYPTLTYSLTVDAVILKGSLPLEEKNALLDKLSAIATPLQLNVNTDDVKITINSNNVELNNKDSQRKLFFLLLADFNLHKLDFEINQTDLSSSMDKELDKIANKFDQLNALAKQVDYNLAVIIIGTSGTTGNAARNKVLSITRAKNVKDALITKGINEEILHTSTIGTMSFQQPSVNLHNLKSRKVLFTVVYIDTQQLKE